jgi:hypothetical protein
MKIMDFDSIVTFLFIIAFFVLPSILKQVQARKKKAAPKQKAGKKPSILGKLGDRIREFILEIERQAREQNQERKQARPAQPSLWETLREEDERVPLEREERSRDADFGELPTVYQKKTDQAKIGPEFEEPFRSQKEVQPAGVPLRKAQPRQDQRRKVQPAGQGPFMRQTPGSPGQAWRFRSRPLQNAVVWSEILSKPLALRDQ